MYKTVTVPTPGIDVVVHASASEAPPAPPPPPMMGSGNSGVLLACSASMVTISLHRSRRISDSSSAANVWSAASTPTRSYDPGRRWSRSGLQHELAAKARHQGTDMIDEMLLFHWLDMGLGRCEAANAQLGDDSAKQDLRNHFQGD